MIASLGALRVIQHELDVSASNLSSAAAAYRDLLKAKGFSCNEGSDDYECERSIDGILYGWKTDDIDEYRWTATDGDQCGSNDDEGGGVGNNAKTLADLKNNIPQINTSGLTLTRVTTIKSYEKDSSSVGGFKSWLQQSSFNQSGHPNCAALNENEWYRSNALGSFTGCAGTDTRHGKVYTGLSGVTEPTDADMSTVFGSASLDSWSPNSTKYAYELSGANVATAKDAYVDQLTNVAGYIYYGTDDGFAYYVKWIDVTARYAHTVAIKVQGTTLSIHHGAEREDSD
jgi:hypothetical protein